MNWIWRYFSVMTRLMKISFKVLRPGLNPACSPSSSPSALAFRRSRITHSMILLGWLLGWWYDSSDITWRCVSLVKVWRTIVSTPSAIPSSPRSCILLLDQRLCILLIQIRPATGCGARSISLWIHRNLLWQLPKDRTMHGSGMSHATTASPTHSFRARHHVG